MAPDWFKKRSYRHLDSPVGDSFIAKASKPTFVAQHSWSPLILFVKKTKRYKPTLGTTTIKNRPIMYASHRDSCILSLYSCHLTNILEDIYQNIGISDNVVAYRKLGKSNYHFSAEVIAFARSKPNCIVNCFDVSDFFGTIDHRILKEKLKHALKVDELSKDWYAVFKSVTKYSFVRMSGLKEHPVLKPRIKRWSSKPLATVAELHELEIAIEQNEKSCGIPQGTPISATFSNLYMVDLDEKMTAICAKHGALYRRYSDDIIIICDAAPESEILATFTDEIENLKLALSSDKTERAELTAGSNADFQYLGFQLSPDDARIRSASLSRQWRKARRSLRHIKKVGDKAIEDGHATKIFTKKLNRRFQPVGIRNFSRYARNAADALDSAKIRRQIVRLERFVRDAIKSL